MFRLAWCMRKENRSTFGSQINCIIFGRNSRERERHVSCSCQLTCVYIAIVADACTCSWVVVGGLESLSSLHTLILSYNQLITTKHLSEAYAVQVLDVAHNHLPLLDAVSQLPLLQSVDACDNNLLSVSIHSSLMYTWVIEYWSVYSIV